MLWLWRRLTYSPQDYLNQALEGLVLPAVLENIVVSYLVHCQECRRWLPERVWTIACREEMCRNPRCVREHTYDCEICCNHDPESTCSKNRCYESQEEYSEKHSLR